MSLSIIPLFAFDFGLFLLPGLAAIAAIAARRKLSTVYAVILSVVVSSLLGYAAFWIYFASKLAGRIFSFGVLVLAAFVLARNLKKREIRGLMRSIAPPFAYAFGAGLCYLCLFFLFSNPLTSRVDLANVRFFEGVRPGDDLIPYIFAERIYDRQPLKPFCCGGWLSSDRPPLQSGIFLLQRPIRFFGNAGLQYQLLGTSLQCLWICGVWVFLNSIGARATRIRQVLGFLIFSGFLYYNSLYLWPKLLSAGLMLFTFAIVAKVVIDDRRIAIGEATLAACSFVLAIMAHPGSLFSAPALVFVLLARPKLITARTCAVSAIVMAMIVVPWIGYQTLYDPPGNRLVKMHLAGVGGIDSHSIWQAVRDAYESQSISTLAHYKWTNVSMLLGRAPIDGLVLGSNTDAARFAQREYVWNAVGILNLGWLAALALFLRRKATRAIPYSGLIVLAALFNLLIWCLVLFGPHAALTAHGSAADILLLSAGLLGFLLTWPRLALLLLLAVQVLNFFIVWVSFKPASVPTWSNASATPALQIPMLIAGMACACGLLWYFGRSYWESDTGSSCPKMDY